MRMANSSVNVARMMFLAAVVGAEGEAVVDRDLA